MAEFDTLIKGGTIVDGTLVPPYRADVAIHGDRIIEVPFARPREEDIKASPEFLAMRRDIWSSLKKGARI